MQDIQEKMTKEEFMEMMSHLGEMLSQSRQSMHFPAGPDPKVFPVLISKLFDGDLVNLEIKDDLSAFEFEIQNEDGDSKTFLMNVYELASKIKDWASTQHASILTYKKMGADRWEYEIVDILGYQEHEEGFDTEADAAIAAGTSLVKKMI